jgi:hypothetical protein
MPTDYLAYRHALAKLYGVLVGKPSVAATEFLPIPLKPRPDETQRRRTGDTDGSRRRAEETKLRHHLH